jgi:hypothetical protein
MAELAQAIRQANERELDANEAALASCFPPPPELSPVARQLLAPFVEWTQAQRVRALPAAPATCAAFAQWQRDLGVPSEKISATLSAIEAMHFAASMGSPIATPLVRTITAASTIEAPRSWTREEKEQLWPQLPAEIQRVVARRDHDRERVMRQAQCEAGELRQVIKRLQAPAEPKAADTTKGNTNGKDT